MSTASAKILSSQNVRVSDAPVRVGDVQASAGMPVGSTSNADANHSHEPQVAVEHDANGNVATITIRCQCGEELIIACDYPNAA